MTQNEKNIQLAQKGTSISIFVYTTIASLKIVMGTLLASSALSADGWNNFTDVLSSIAIFFGIRVAKQPADDEHQYGHWKIESIASLISSFIMFFIGIQVLVSAINDLITGKQTTLNPIIALASFIASIIMFVTYLYNNKLAKHIQSIGLLAVSKNNLSDALTSFLTALSMLLALLFQLHWLDAAMAFIVACIILKTAWSVFKDSSFVLSDGFNAEQLKPIHDKMLSHPEIRAIRQLKARYYGSDIYVDATVLMDPHLTVKESHDITEVLEKELYTACQVKYMDIHVEPSDT